MQTVTSSQSKILKRVKKLSKSRKFRAEENTFIIQNQKLLREACDSGVTVHTVLASPEIIRESGEELALLLGDSTQILQVDSDLLATSTDLQSSAGLIALAEQINHNRTLPDSNLPILVLVQLQDPGNVGTLIRSAEAAGVQCVICLGDSVDIYNPKVIRSAAGSSFRVPTLHLQTISELKQYVGERKLIAAVVDEEAKSYLELDLTGDCILLGNEAKGLPVEILNQVDQKVYINQAGNAESLNVAIAGSLLCFESLRQRTTVN